MVRMKKKKKIKVDLYGLEGENGEGEEDKS